MGEKHPGKIRRHGRLWRYVPLVLWIGVILFASTSSASMASTSRFVRPVLEFLFPGASEADLLVYHGYVRKLAHFVEYSVLALLAARAFRSSGRDWLRKYWPAAAFLLVLTVASADEFNQSFNPLRTGSPYDILLDGFAGLTMICILTLIGPYLGKHREGE